MLEILKTIRDAEREAMKILEEANIQAENIRKGTQEKAEEVYKKAYEQTVAEAKRRSIELKKGAREDAEREAESFLHHAEEPVKEIRTKAEKKFDEAVNAALNEILS